MQKRESWTMQPRATKSPAEIVQPESPKAKSASKADLTNPTATGAKLWYYGSR